MNQADYINLIHKKLSGEISERELIMLSDWLELNESNKSTAEEIAYVWEHASFEVFTPLPEEEVLASLEELEKRIDQEPAKKLETKVLPLYKRKWSVAAAVLALVGLGGFALFQSFSTTAEWAEATTGEGEEKEVLLADGSVIFLNANSHLKYPVSFDGEKREVELTGEGFFEIAKDPKHPFVVHTAYEDVTVLGTSFNVRAYDGEPNTEVTVATGKVQVHSGLVETTLLPTEKAIVDHSSGVMEFVDEADMNELAWHTGQLNFENTPLSVVEEELEQAYNVDIEIGNEALINCPFKASFTEKESLATILEAIKTVFGVQIHQEGNQYRLAGGRSCE